MRSQDPTHVVRVDRLRAAEVLVKQAAHLAAHPAGTEAMVAKLRSIRRGYQAAERFAMAELDEHRMRRRLIEENRGVFEQLAGLGTKN